MNNQSNHLTFIYISRVIWLLIVPLLIFIILASTMGKEDGIYWLFYFFFLLDLIPFLIGIMSLCLQEREYVIDKLKIQIYAGFFHCELKVNNQLMDKIFNNGFHTTLSTTVEDTFIEVNISPFNRIYLKINNRFVSFHH